VTDGRRVVVTGAGGFIGTAVCRVLTLAGAEIRALVAAPGDRIEAPPGIAFDVRAAINDQTALRSLIDANVDAVIHLAGPPSVRSSFDDPLRYADAHTGGTAAVLHACRQARVANVVYVSSAEVYGRPRTDPVAESHPLEARSPYAAAKIGAEQMIRAFDHAYGTSSAILRPFSVYGPGMGQHALLPAILRQVDLPGPVRLADLRPVRDLCHVDDVARAIVAAAFLPRAQTLTLNIGSGTGISVEDLARTALRLVGRDCSVAEDRGTRRPGNADILRLVADRSQALRLLDWEPHISLNRGLLEMLQTRTNAP
jgi:nucleoside-diphosphate-sugar epimerase